MWRRIFKSTELPPVKKRPDEEDGLVLGILAIAVLTLSLPYLFGYR